MGSPDLRQLRSLVVVAEELSFPRAAGRLEMAQPSLRAAIRELEQQLGVALLHRTTPEVELTAAGQLLAQRARAVLDHADAVFSEVRELDRAPVRRLTIGMSAAARFGVAPALLAACAREAPSVRLVPREDTTGALLRDLRTGRLDLVLGFCAPPGDDLERERIRDEPAVLHVPADHRLAAREHVALPDLRDERLIVAGGDDSPGYTQTVLDLCRQAGFEPRTVADPYPDLGLQSVREGLGAALFVRTAFAAQVEGSVFVPVDPTVTLPFDLLWRTDRRSAALDPVLSAVRALRHREAWLVEPAGRT